jgi:hypothetical protein
VYDRGKYEKIKISYVFIIERILYFTSYLALRNGPFLNELSIFNSPLILFGKSN